MTNIIFKKNTPSKDEVIDKTANYLKAKHKAQIRRGLNEAESKDFQKILDVVRNESPAWTKDKTMRRIATGIPADIFHTICKVYGWQNLRRDKRLLKKVLEPWLVVKPKSI